MSVWVTPREYDTLYAKAAGVSLSAYLRQVVEAPRAMRSTPTLPDSTRPVSCRASCNGSRNAFNRHR